MSDTSTTTTTCATCGQRDNNIEDQPICAVCYATTWIYAAPDPQNQTQVVAHNNMYAALEAWEEAVVALNDAIADLQASHATTPKGATT